MILTRKAALTISSAFKYFNSLKAKKKDVTNTLDRKKTIKGKFGIKRKLSFSIIDPQIKNLRKQMD